MRKLILCALTATASLTLAACDSNKSAEPRSEAAKEAAGGKTILDGLSGDGRFAAAIKSAGLDATLSGPGPYTVLAPSDAAFDKLGAAKLDPLLKPENRPALTKLLTGHILPGTILAADIAKAIDAGKGKTQLPTMGGGTLTATRDGDRIVLTDAAGGKAVITGSDEARSNGVIHRIDGVLSPA